MSQTYISALVILITTIASLFNFKIGSDELTKVLEAVVVLIGGAIILWRRYRYGDISIVGIKK